MAKASAAGRSFLSLGWTALQAFGGVSPGWVESLFGDWRSWLPPHREFSEFGILNPLRPDRFAAFMAEAAVPGVWRPTGIFKHADHEGDYDSHPDEKWFFINGVVTNRAVAKLNARLLAEIFHRPLTVIHNSTNSLPVDILETAVGKAWSLMTEPARIAYPLLLEALKDRGKKRVIVICHSQGTVIMANLLRALDQTPFRKWLFSEEAGADPAQASRRPPPLGDRARLGKLEIYAFANCADRMTHSSKKLLSQNGRRVPWIESFGNEFDSVARLGMLAHGDAARDIRIDGDAYVRRGAWGHLLNQHYLFAVQDHLNQPDTPPPFTPLDPDRAGGDRPRLYEYFAGRRPAPY